MNAVRWGILGAANFARKHMGPAIHAAHGADLVALATSDPAKAAGFTEFAPNLRVHASYDALLADPGIDAVYVPLPNHLHIEWALKALAAGKHVLVEKPVALRADQIDALIAARDAQGLVAAEAFMIVHHPQWQQARDWLAAGAIGTLRHVDAVFSYNNTDAANIRNRPETGGGSLPDIGVYTLGSTRFVTGAEPVEMSARIVRDRGVEVFAQLAATMRGPGGGFTYGSTTSMRMYNRQAVTFQGDTGMIRLEGGCFNAGVNDLASVELHQDGNRVTHLRYPAVDQYVLQVQAFGRAVRGGDAYFPSLEFARGTQSMIDMAYDTAVEITV